MTLKEYLKFSFKSGKKPNFDYILEELTNIGYNTKEINIECMNILIENLQDIKNFISNKNERIR